MSFFFFLQEASRLRERVVLQILVAPDLYLFSRIYYVYLDVAKRDSFFTAVRTRVRGRVRGSHERAIQT
jgi:hypothetical protein